MNNIRNQASSQKQNKNTVKKNIIDILLSTYNLNLYIRKLFLRTIKLLF